jgi:hypothetical protein
MSIPAGKQLVTWHATVINFGPANTNDIFRCFAIASNQVGATTTVAEAATSLNAAPGQDVQTISNQAEINQQSAGTVVLACSHDADVSGAGKYYIDPGASISAVPSS